MSGPLEGLRIVEMAGLVAAPYGCMLLADLGAEVVRVERADVQVLGSGKDPLLRNRRSVRLNLKQPAAIEVLLRMVDGADGIVESFRPGVAERLGFGPETCLARNERLIYARLTGWGQSGPLAHAAGHDLNYIALSGLLHQIGSRGSKPVPPFNVVGDFAGGGLLLAFGFLAAVVERAASGRGQIIDVAMLDGAVSFLSKTIDNLAEGCWRDAPGENFLSGAAHYYDTYRTKDGKYVAIAAVEERFHDLLLQKLGLDPDRFRIGVGYAAERYDELIEVWPGLKRELAEVFATKTRDEWCSLLEGTDACFAPVLEIGEAPCHPHNVARRAFVEIEGLKQNAPVPRFSRTPAGVPSSPPQAGADTSEILGGLGYSSAEIDALRAAGVIS